MFCHKADILSCYIQLEEEAGLQFNFFSSSLGKNIRIPVKWIGSLLGISLILLLVPYCRTFLGECNGWDDFYPTDFEFKETLSTATLRSGGCYPDSWIQSGRFTVNELDGVSVSSDLALRVDCEMRADFPESSDSITGPFRFLDLSHGRRIKIDLQFIRDRGQCGIVVRPGRLEYDTFYALYMFRSQTDGFDEPDVFQDQKWKSFRNKIDSEADELYRDALNQAGAMWGASPNSFRLIQAFTTRSFRALSVPALGSRNLYYAALPSIRLLEPENIPSARIEVSPVLLDLETSGETESSLDPAALLSRNRSILLTLRRLEESTGLRLKFALVPEPCRSASEDCRLRGTSPDGQLLIPFLVPPNSTSWKQLVVMPLDSIFPVNRMQRLAELQAKLARQKRTLVVYLGPLPYETNNPDQIQSILLAGASSLEPLAGLADQIALYCSEKYYCPMLGLYSRTVNAIVSPAGFGKAKPPLQTSFPPDEYRKSQVQESVYESFRFYSYLPELERASRALRRSPPRLVLSLDDLWTDEK